MTFWQIAPSVCSPVGVFIKLFCLDVFIFVENIHYLGFFHRGLLLCLRRFFVFKEKADLLKNAGERVLLGLLPIVDDFERGLAAVEADTSGS